MGRSPVFTSRLLSSVMHAAFSYLN